MYYLKKICNESGFIDSYELLSNENCDECDLFISQFNLEIKEIRKRVLRDVLLTPKQIQIDVEEVIITRIDEYLCLWLEEGPHTDVDSVKCYYYPY